jgi:hypothetical protein
MLTCFHVINCVQILNKKTQSLKKTKILRGLKLAGKNSKNSVIFFFLTERPGWITNNVL